MKQTNRSDKENPVYQALLSIYTGVFLIDLKSDSYKIIDSTEVIAMMLKGITSAQKAINCAIQKTVSSEEIIDMLSFVNLVTLPDRMKSSKTLNIEYQGNISGWVRGNFIEVERDQKGNLTKVLYTYQIIDEKKRKELEKLQQLTADYNIAEKENQEITDLYEIQKTALLNDLKYHNDFTKIIMEQIDCGVIVYTVPGRNILQINREALRIYGWKDIEDAQTKLLGKWNDTIFIRPEDRKKLITLRKTDGSIKFQFTVDHGKQNEKQILAECKSLSGRHGGKIVISTLVDITPIRNLEADKALLTNEKEHLTIENTELQRARDAVYSLLNSGSYICNYDKTGKKLVSIKYSEALRKLYGYSGKEDAPDTWEMWLKSIYPEDKKYVVKSYLSALADRTGNTNYDVTYRALKKDGTIRWHRAAGHIMRRKDGTADSCYGFVMDIDEQKKASDKVEEALKTAELANKAKTSFLSRMSHDIRTPMNGIMGLIEINEKHADDVEFTTRNRRKAKIAAQHLLSLINDILQLSKLEDPEIELVESPFNIVEVMNDIFTIVEMKAKENGITIERNDEIDAFQYPYLWGSPLHVRQIYLNILSNAIKYNKKNGKILCCASTKKIDSEHILFKIKIKDTGIGMTEEFKQHIFDPFTREHEEETTGIRQGTGLGMSIVKQLVDKMNGTIHVESELAKGTCFCVEIPFKLAYKEDLVQIKEPNTSGDLTGKHILLVEDNELNMDIAETLLSDAGAKITKAVNGQQALGIFSNRMPNTFDVILMDIMMPVMDGYEATRRIRLLDREDAKTIPIIAMTANAFMEDVKKAKEEGMNDHLAKPLDTEKMLAVITKNIMN